MGQRGPPYLGVSVVIEVDLVGVVVQLNRHTVVYLILQSSFLALQIFQFLFQLLCESACALTQTSLDLDVRFDFVLK